MKALKFILITLISFMICSVFGVTEITPLVAFGLIAGSESVPFNALGFNVYNVTHPTDKIAGSGKKLRYRVYYVLSEQVDVDNIPALDADLQLTDLPLVTGEHWHYLDAIPTKVESNSKSAGDIGRQYFQPELTMDFAGWTENLRKFVHENLNSYFYLVYEDCLTGTKYIFGSKCSPAQMTVTEAGHMAEKTGAILVFKTDCPYPPVVFTGSIDDGGSTSGSGS